MFIFSLKNVQKLYLYLETFDVLSVKKLGENESQSVNANLEVFHVNLISSMKRRESKLFQYKRVENKILTNDQKYLIRMQLLHRNKYFHSYIHKSIFHISSCLIFKYQLLMTKIISM